MQVLSGANCFITDMGAQQIETWLDTRADTFREFTCLRLTFCSLTTRTLRKLMTLSHLETIEFGDIEQSRFEDGPELTALVEECKLGGVLLSSAVMLSTNILDVVEKLGSVVSIGLFGLSQAHPMSDILRVLAAMDTVTSLTVKASIVPASLVSYILSSGSIRHLQLSQSDVMGGGIATLLLSTHIERLEVVRCEHVYVDMQYAGKNTNLDGQLACSRITDLVIHGVGSDGVGICKFAAKLPKLVKLDVSGNHLPPSSVKHLMDNLDLESLTAKRCGIGDKGASVLAKSTTLRYLDISNGYMPGLSIRDNKVPIGNNPKMLFTNNLVLRTNVVYPKGVDIATRRAKKAISDTIAVQTGRQFARIEERVFKYL